MKKKVSYKAYEAFQNSIWEEFLNQATQEELFCSVSMSNFDGNSFLVEWIKNNPKVDVATIRGLYWLCEPRFHKQYKNREECLVKDPWTIEDYDLIEELEQKIANGFFTESAIAFDPTDYLDDDWTLIRDDETQQQEIPEVMFQKIEGKIVEMDYYAYTEGLPNAYYDRIETYFNEHNVAPWTGED